MKTSEKSTELKRIAASIIFIAMTGAALSCEDFASGFTLSDEAAAESSGLETVNRALGFSGARFPVKLKKSDFITHPKTKTILEDSASCRECHKTVYDNWMTSRHRVSFTNGLYRESHAREGSLWCTNCHAPLVFENSNPELPEKRHLKEEGISCIVCHIRGGKVITGSQPLPGPSGRLDHEYTVLPAAENESFCEACHQFNFPAADAPPNAGKNFHYSGLVMQNTVEEFRSSSFSGSMVCQDCHLQRDTADSHTFPGGHSVKILRESLYVELASPGPETVAATLYTMGVGHALPTGDLFRKIILIIRDPSGGKKEKIIFSKEFAPYEKDASEIHGENQSGASKYLSADTAVPPPENGDYISAKSAVMKWDQNIPDFLIYELYIDYLHPVNRLFTALPLEETIQLIKKEKIKVKKDAEAKQNNDTNQNPVDTGNAKG